MDLENRLRHPSTRGASMGKKGIIFSLLAIGFSGLFILLFSSSIEQPVDAGIAPINTRVLELDNGINDFFSYAQNSLDTCGFSALNALYTDINNTGNHLAAGTFETRLSNCLNDSSGCNNTLNMSAVLDEYTRLLRNTSRMALDFNVNTVSISDEQHWQLEITANVSINVTDQYASWRTSKLLITTLSTVGAPDPAYVTINDDYNGNEERIIIPNERQDFVEWDLDSFVEFLTGAEYHASLNGPCLSSRYEAQYDEQNDDCGLESVVDPNYHSILMNTSYDSLVHMDYQVLNEASNRYPCDDLMGGMPRVSIRAVHRNLTLTRQDATRYGLNNESIWYFTPALNATTARGCPYFI